MTATGGRSAPYRRGGHAVVPSSPFSAGQRLRVPASHP
ncbi:hypothetical protein SFR_6453 [Streptomyces sp. FR-008]|nr:hypothetical protein SFR_6453 [Streptomyces sp. FR-008]